MDCYKTLVESIYKMQSEKDYMDVTVEIDKALESEKITDDEHEVLHGIASRIYFVSDDGNE